jgi:hypothetical protein
VFIPNFGSLQLSAARGARMQKGFPIPADSTRKCPVADMKTVIAIVTLETVPFTV